MPRHLKQKARRLAGIELAVVMVVSLAVPALCALPDAVQRVEANGGSVSFEVATNVFGTKVRGKSKSLSAASLVRVSDAALRLERVEATVPVATLKTGIRLRDQHMLKYIFQSPDGRVQDVRFAGESAECQPASKPETYGCAVSGSLTIRGSSRPFAMTLDVARDGAAYRVNGAGTLALSTFGIARPSQFGVTTADAVAIQIEFTARAAAVPDRAP